MLLLRLLIDKEKIGSRQQEPLSYEFEPDHFRQRRVVWVPSAEYSAVKEIKTRDLGLILIELGGGRKQVTDKINFNVGYDQVLRVGDKVDTNTPLLTVYTNSEDDYKNVRKKIVDCFVIVDSEVSKLPYTYEAIN